MYLRTLGTLETLRSLRTLRTPQTKKFYLNASSQTFGFLNTSTQGTSTQLGVLPLALLNLPGPAGLPSGQLDG